MQLLDCCFARPAQQLRQAPAAAQARFVGAFFTLSEQSSKISPKSIIHFDTLRRKVVERFKKAPHIADRDAAKLGPGLGQ
jgi:hypothetical protein